MEFSNLELHPFVKENQQGYILLPPQTVPLSVKVTTKKGVSDWGKKCLDAFSSRAAIQYFEKKKLRDKYKLVQGELIIKDYFDDTDKEQFDLINQVSQELQIPSTIKSYNIISQPFNTMVGELSELPDLFLVVGKGDKFESDKLKIKNEMLIDYFNQEVKRVFYKKMLEKGIDPDDPGAIQDEDQQQEFQRELQEIESKEKPEEIQALFNTNWKHKIEIWAQRELEDQFARFNIKKLQRVEFSDYLTVGERYRFIYKDAYGLRVESLNPCNVFSSKSPAIEYIQDGDYAGYIEFLSINSLIDKYGYLMSKKQIESLQKGWMSYYSSSALGRTADNSKIGYLHPSGNPYQTMLPTLDADINRYAPWMGSFNNNFILDEVEKTQMTGNSVSSLYSSYGLVAVVNCFWKTQKKVGKLYWINPELQQPEKILVDETFVLPKYIKEIEGNLLYSDLDEINTISWSYIEETWRGKKVLNMLGSGLLTEPMYLQCEPNDLQFKGELMLYGSKLPIAGQYANNRNTVITSFVDQLSNLQFFYNILMNQCFHFFQTEVLPFIIMDAGIMLKDKDWGGERGLEKWMDLAERMGVTLINTSTMNTQGAQTGGQFPKTIDLDRGQRVLSRLQVANTIRQLALQQVGMSEQRLGDIKSYETATGIQQATSRSYIQTAYWYDSFFECEREILQMQLDAAQYLQSNNLDFTHTYINSKYTDSLLQINGDDFNLYQLHIYVLKSQAELKKLEFARRMSIENNTSPIDFSDRIELGTTSNLQEILSVLKQKEAELKVQQQKEFELKQQDLQDRKDTEEKQIASQEKLFLAKLQNELDKATISAFGYSNSANEDLNGNGFSDMLEFYNSRVKEAEVLNNIKDTNVKQKQEEKKLDLEKQKMSNNSQDLANQRLHEQILADKKIIQAQIQGDKKK